MIVLYFESLHFGWLVDYVYNEAIEDRPVNWDRCRWIVPGTLNLED